jgi:hypothetical protein
MRVAVQLLCRNAAGAAQLAENLQYAAGCVEVDEYAGTTCCKGCAAFVTVQEYPTTGADLLLD